ncbi:MAG: hypothetical protein R3C26_18480 [Calditrichia bacterium]
MKQTIVNGKYPNQRRFATFQTRFCRNVGCFCHRFSDVAQNAVAFSAPEEKPMPKLIKQVAPNTRFAAQSGYFRTRHHQSNGGYHRESD